MRRVVGLMVVGMFLVGAAAVASADEGPNVSVGASVSYTLDLNDPDAGSENTAAYANQEAQESFGVDMLQVGVSGDRGSVAYAAKLTFGDLASAVGDTESGSEVTLQEANISYDAGGVTVTAGRFGTHIGYEVLEPWGNPHISRSMNWGLQPITHDGVTLSTAIGSADVMLGAVNNSNVSDSSNDADDEMGVIVSVGCAVGDVSVSVAGLYDETDASDTDTTILNAIVSGDAGDIGWALEGNYVEEDAATDTEAVGVALYLGTSVGETDLDLRVEWADDERSGGRGLFGQDSDAWGVSLTGSWALTDGVDLRLEYRHDDSDDAVFNDEGSTDDSLDVVQAQLVWHP